VTRPLQPFRVDELTRRFESARGDRSALLQLQEELTQRSTPSARGLLDEVKRALARLPTHPPAPQARNQLLGIGAATGSSSTVHHASAAADGGSAAQVPVDYEWLRKSFTAESELLARWGMTASLPDDLMENLFAKWIERLTSTPDQWGRTVDSARRDLAKVQEIRRLATPAEAPAAARVTSGSGR
jgi:hypothetical protein